MIEHLITGFSQLDPLALGLLFAGTVVGLIFGCVPGLSGSTALTLAIPLTLTLQPVQAFAAFMGIFVGGCSGGLISAILIGIPGTPSSLTTVFDGHTMAKNGQPGRALGIAICYSFLGTMIGLVTLLCIAEPLARIAIKFGPIELFAIILFALSLVSVLSGDDLVKGWIVAIFGVLLGMVGMSAVDGVPRMTLGIGKLTSGFSQTPAMVGIFVVGNLFAASLADKSSIGDRPVMHFKIKGLGFTFREFRKQFGNFVRSALIGLGIGILPGIGGVTSNLVSYTVAKTVSKEPEKFGTGCMDGIVAPETANNASVGGSMITMLALGIPGDGFTALLLGAVTLHGFVAGPTLFTNNGNFVYAIFASLLLAAILSFVVEYFGLPLLVKTLKIPKHILMPVVLVMVMVGCFSVNNRVFECWVLLFFALVAYLFKKFKFSMTPIVLGFILGPDLEKNLRRAMMLSHNDVTCFFTSPVSCAFIVLAVVSTIFLLHQNKRQQRRLDSIAAASQSKVDSSLADDD